MKTSYIPTLIELLEMGAKDRPISITTAELGQKLGKSQQLASKHLEEMEREGMIERIRSGGKTYVKLTKKGISSGASLYSTLSRVYGSTEIEKIDITGTVFSGLGEGAYYVSMKGYKRQFLAKLGFEPFPGTMNLRLDSPVYRKVRRDLETMKGIHIDGFKDGKRTFGGAECFRATLNGKIEGAVLVIERTIHDEAVLEIISPLNLRKQFRLKDGDPMTVRIFPEKLETTA
ncbi:MAG TPA: DUF120 domain-containing protein [Nitrososphaerales archaeon]|nr:DUF120 domain-containing protein [Nitrososphaerales archaeon]